MIKTLFVASIFCGFALAQDSDSFDKAPPAIDQALRARVDAFYQAHVDGKPRKADEYVAEDSKDYFFEAEKPHYKGCMISKIDYSENFTKANVITGCKNEFFFPGQRATLTVPISSRWKLENGQWFWYFVRETERVTPFGVMHDTPDAPGPSSPMPAIPQDPLSAAREIFSKVAVEPSSVTVDQTRSSTQEIHLRNGLPGALRVSVDPTGVPGMTIKPAKPDVGPGEEIAITIAFNFDDPAITCPTCLLNPGVRPPVTATVRVEPTGQQFPVQIVFTQPPPKK
jgi:hypothetical protein